MFRTSIFILSIVLAIVAQARKASAEGVPCRLLNAPDPIVFAQVPAGSLGKHGRWVDGSEAATLAEACAAPSRSFEEETPRRSGPLWIHFRVRATTVSVGAWILDLGPSVDVQRFEGRSDRDGYGPPRLFGVSHPFDLRDVQHASVAVRILPSSEDREYWLRVVPKMPMTIDPQLLPEARFWELKSRDQMLLGIYFGMLFALAVYNLFVYFGTRFREYRIYAAFQLSFVLSQAAFEKYIFQLLLPSDPDWASKTEQALFMLTAAAALAFGCVFLRMEKISAPTIETTMRRLIAVNLLIAGACVVFHVPAKVIGVLIPVNVGLVAAVTVWAAMTRFKDTAIFMIAWILLLPGSITAALWALDIVQIQVGVDLLKVGSAVAAVLLSVALSVRINNRREERERARDRLLLTKSERVETLGRLVSSVAHEVGNPLNYGRGGAVELDARLAEADLDGAKRAFRLVAAGFKGIENVLDDLRLSLRGQEADPVPTDLTTELHGALELARDSLDAYGISVVTEIEPLPLVRARPGQLHQVFINLITNAIQAMPGGGTLTVEAHTLDGYVDISIRDTGAGVAPEHRDLIFEPFFTTHSGEGGSGLGLAIAKEIVARHGGELRLNARPADVGACFSIALPVVSDDKNDQLCSSVTDGVSP